LLGNALANSIISVGLSAPAQPLPALNSLVDHLEAAESSLESQGLSKIHAAMEKALSNAKTQIESAIAGSKSSFLTASDDNSILIRPLSGPGVSSENLQEVSNLEGVRSSVETQEIDQAATEFDALTKVVVGELKSALRGSSSFVDVQVTAGTASFPTVEDLLESMEHHRDASEAGTRGKILELEIQFVRQLNAIIARALH
jgi:hypothetical protein